MNETRPSNQSNPDELRRMYARTIELFAASDAEAARAAEERERDRSARAKMAREQEAAAMARTIAMFQAPEVEAERRKD